MTRLANIPVDSIAERLWRGVRDLDVGYGVERSVRICHHAILADRYLLSLDLAVVRQSCLEELLTLIEHIDPPREVLPSLMRLLAHARFIHFGYEHTGWSHLYKIYAELAAPTRPSADEARAHVRFWALKWDVEQPTRYVISRYKQRPFTSFDELRKMVEHEFYGLCVATASHRFTMDMLSVLAGVSEASDLSLLEVTEPGNRRRSFDLNLANLELRIDHFATELTQLFSNDAIPNHHLTRFFDGIGTMPLGHIAAGVHRGGEDFVNLYYGTMVGHA